jgi:hypothetical protein
MDFLKNLIGEGEMLCENSWHAEHDAPPDAPTIYPASRVTE